MIYSGAGNLPSHRYVLIEPNAIGDHDWLPAVWFGLSAMPGRAWGCHVLLECGAVYRNVPLHQLATHKEAPPWSVEKAQSWDCYGYEFSTIEYSYLSGLVTVCKAGGLVYGGEYWFTAIPIGDAYTASPDQAKEFYFMELENGRITCQPTNHLLIQEKSFTTELTWPKFLRCQEEIWSCE